jgi:hypothetical protein
MRVQVESVADSRGVEMPRRFHLRGRKVEIVEGDDQWHGADYRYFKVKGDDGNVYILRFDEPSSEWEPTSGDPDDASVLREVATSWIPS